MEIYAALKADHREVKKLLKDLEKTEETDKKKRLALLKQLKEALVPHSRAEEIVFYEPLKKAKIKEADSLAFEGYEEHAVVDQLMKQLEANEPDDKKWTALMSVAKESLEHHIEEEEEEMFEKGKKAFDRSTAIKMAEDFASLKKGYLQEVRSGKTPKQPPSYEIVGSQE